MSSDNSANQSANVNINININKSALDDLRVFDPREQYGAAEIDYGTPEQQAGGEGTTNPAQPEARLNTGEEGDGLSRTFARLRSAPTELALGEEFDPTFNQDLSRNIVDPRSPEFLESIRLTPATLAHYRTQGRWHPAAHLQYIAAELAYELVQGDARLIVEVPPRHGKSELISVNTPIWFLDRYPYLQVILTTYAAELSQRFGRRVRDVFVEDRQLDFLRARISRDAQRIDVFNTTEGGGMMSVGIGGPITGFGAHLLVVDDYVKNFVEAMSETINEATWNWFLSTAYTRLEPGGSVVILATRWAINDLIGRLKESTGEEWRVIRMPALAEAGDLLGRLPGEALWSKRYPRERLLRIKSLIGDWLFDALYQQAPRNQADTTVDPEDIREYGSLDEMQPHTLRWIRSWDFAGSEKKRADFTRGMLMGTAKHRNRLATCFLADCVGGQLRSDKVESLVRATAEEDGTGVHIVIPQDPGAGGKQAAEHMANTVLKGFHVTIMPQVNTQKLVRAQPYLAAVGHGRVAALKGAWLKTHRRELKDFPDGRHDDTVDATAQGYNYLFQTWALSPTWGRREDGLIVPGHLANAVTGRLERQAQGMALVSSGSDGGSITRLGERRTVVGVTWGRRR